MLMPVARNVEKQAMSTLDSVTPIVLTFDEMPNIERTLAKLSWAKRIVVVDSGSKDGTLELLAKFPQVEVFHKNFETFAGQSNHALAQVRTEWVLSMDADYVLTDEFVPEMERLVSVGEHDSYWASFRFCIRGKPLRSDNTTPRRVLYRKSKAGYYDDGHTQRVRIDGTTGHMQARILHDDRKSLSRWLSSQDKYSRREAEKLLSTPFAELDRTDQLRRMLVLAPFVMPFFCLFARGLILDGWAGIFYSLQRTLVELLLSIRLIESSKLQNRP